MKLLIIGGTVFLGRALVEAAIAGGHEVTLFNRGRHNPDLFPAVEKLRGDRTEDLSALHGRHWDAAIDTCGYVPRVVRASAELLSSAVGHYTFISSISVYRDFGSGVVDEGSPVGTLEDPTVEQVTNDTYGPLKALCEAAAEDALPGRTLTIRPGLIVGPHDPSDRFTYWPRRVAQGGDVLAPDQPERQVQVIDVRDLAEWNLRQIVAGVTGVFNATGPDYRLSIGTLLAECQAVSGSDARLVWIPEAFLIEQGAGPWIEVPLWTPGEDAVADCGRAIASGLRFRPLATTIRDTLAWDATLPEDRGLRAGLTPEREGRFLDAWRNR